MSDNCRHPGCTRDDASCGYCPQHWRERGTVRQTPPHMLGAKAEVESNVIVPPYPPVAETSWDVLNAGIVPPPSLKLNKEEGPIAKCRRLEQENDELRHALNHKEGLVESWRRNCAERDEKLVARELAFDLIVEQRDNAEKREAEMIVTLIEAAGLWVKSENGTLSAEGATQLSKLLGIP